MSSWTENGSIGAPADVAITEPPPDIVKLVELVACVISENGLKMERTMMNANKNDSRYSFLKSSNRYHAFYQKKLSECRARNPDGGAAQDHIQPPDAPATYDERVRVPLPPPSKCLPKPLAPYTFALIKPPQGITLKELCIIKLTAQFAARYGMYFLADLIKRPQFEFIKETDSRCDYFTKLVVAYSRVLKRSKSKSKRRVCMETVLEGFSEHLGLEKLEEGSDMAISDLHDLVSGIDFFVHMEVEESSAKKVPLPPQMQPAGGFPVTPPLRPNSQLPRLSVEDLFIFPPRHSQKLSSSGQNDLQSGQHMSSQAPADVKIIEPTSCIRRKVERTALLVSQECLEIERRIRDCNVGNRRFNFLKSSDPCHAFYQKKLTEYRACNQDGQQPFAPVSPPRGPLRLRPANIESPPQGVTLKELCIMKLTAQFVARYGIFFSVEMEKRVTGNPLFEFLEKRRYADSSYYGTLVRAYSRVLRRSDKLNKRDYTDYILNNFFEKLKFEKQEGVEMAMKDLQAFLGLVDYFAHMEKEEESCMGMMMMRPPPEEPEPKRPKLEALAVDDDTT